MNKTFIGKRLPDETEPYLLKDGEYCKYKGFFHARTPNGLSGSFQAHNIVEHEDGTITASPSILVKDWRKKSYHGYLTKGIWRECT